MFVSLGSAAENIEAAVDYLRERRGVTVGSIPINVFRPFPEAAVVKALAGKKNVIVLERTDEPMAGDNPMGAISAHALNKALQGEAGLPTITADQMPRLFGGVYGLGSRDFRPEHTIGAYEFAMGQRARKDGKRASDGASFMVLGVDHPYEVKSDDTPSLLPDKAIAFASTPSAAGAPSRPARTSAPSSATSTICSTSATRSSTSSATRRRSSTSAPTRNTDREEGRADLMLHDRRPRTHSRQLRSATSTSFCCDPKAFTHNPLDGMSEGGCLVWESDEEGEAGVGAAAAVGAQQIIDKKIRVFTLPGFKIAREATDRGDLQLRMQGNAFSARSFGVADAAGLPHRLSSSATRSTSNT